MNTARNAKAPKPRTSDEVLVLLWLGEELGVADVQNPVALWNAEDKLKKMGVPVAHWGDVISVPVAA